MPYACDARAERKSWTELDEMVHESAVEDAVRWYKRLARSPRHLHDASIGTVRLHVGSLIGYIDRLKGGLDNLRQSAV